MISKYLLTHTTQNELTINKDLRMPVFLINNSPQYVRHG